MRPAIEETESRRQYAAAHEAHYGTKDLHEALQLYGDVISTHPDTQEAEYSRTQIQNIVRTVVPKEELFSAQVGLAFVHCAHGSSENVAPQPLAPLGAGPP